MIDIKDFEKDVLSFLPENLELEKVIKKVSSF